MDQDTLMDGVVLQPLTRAALVVNPNFCMGQYQVSLESKDNQVLPIVAAVEMIPNQKTLRTTLCVSVKLTVHNIIHLI